MMKAFFIISVVAFYLSFLICRYADMKKELGKFWAGFALIMSGASVIVSGLIIALY